jgi:hypothetical protein
MAFAWPYIDSIWRAEGEVSLADPLTAAEAFVRLDPLFQTPGTRYAIDGDTLSYTKHNPAAQDKLATFTRGTFRIESSSAGTSRLLFNVRSTALLLCFLAPLLFLSFAQLMVTVNAWEKSATEAAEAEKAKDKDKDKKKDEAKPAPKLHPLDQWLGAPAPESPEEKKKKMKEKKDEGKFNPTPAYVLAGIFFALFLVGRVLEPWLLKRTLRAALASPADESAAMTGIAGAFPAPKPDAS